MVLLALFVVFALAGGAWLLMHARRTRAWHRRLAVPLVGLVLLMCAATLVYVGVRHERAS